MASLSLRRGLPLLLLGVSLVLALTLFALENLFASAWVESSLTRFASFSAQHNVPLLANNLERGDRDMVVSQIRTLVTQPYAEQAMLFDPDDRVEFSADPGLIGLGPAQVRAAQLALVFKEVRAAHMGRTVRDSEQGRLWSVFPVDLPRGAGETGLPRQAVLVISYDIRGAEAVARRHALLMSLAVIGILGLFALGLWVFLGRFVVRRLEKVMDQAESAMLGNEWPELPLRAKTGWDELSVLSRRLHTLAAVLHDRSDALQTSQARLRALVDGSVSLICILDTDGRVLDINLAALHFTGAERSALIGRRLWDVLWWAHDTAAQGRLCAAVAKVVEGQRVCGEAVYPDAEGRPCHLSYTISPVRDASGAIIGIVPEARDVSQTRHAETQLRETGERFRTLVENALVGVYMTDEEGMIYANPRLNEIFGYGGTVPAIRSFSDLVAPDSSKAVLEQVWACLRGDLPSAYLAFQGLRRDGRVIEVELHAARTEHQGRPALIGVMLDVSERVRASAQLGLLAKVFDHSRDAIVIADSRRRILEVNPAFCEMTGYARDEVLGRNPRMFASGRHGADFYGALWSELGAQGYWQGEIYNRRKNGEVFPLWMTLIGARDSSGAVTHFIAIQTDASAYKEAEARIHRLAYYDMLTGLPNRVLLRERAAALLSLAERRGRPIALLFLDLDRFKNINDSLGHLAGDHLLEQVAARLEKSLREEDTVARLGGDEFVMVLPDTGADGATCVARKVLDVLSTPYQVLGRAISVTPSLGISVFPEDGGDFDALMQHADTAMYEAKAAGRGTYRFYTHALNERAVERLVIDTALRGALERAEFYLHYQPQIDLATGRIVGVEALLRWNHPEFGMVSPAKYIPMAEENGLILPIGRWVLEEACRQAMAWRAAGLPHIAMSVNISARQFQSGCLFDEVSQVLSATGLPPHHLELELTEGMLIEDVEHTVATLDGLKRAGVRLALDDFGTGYSSLAYLRRFAIDRIKIDQSFVRDLLSDADDRVIALSVIQLGHGLGLTVIAEGVETEAQAGILRDNGCDEAQGYFFGRPLLPQVVAERLQVDVMVMG